MYPIITIGMPTKDRISCIDRVLDSVASQTYPKDRMKIVFVDESTDGTFEKLLEWKKQHGHEYRDIQVLRAESKGYISYVRNVCVRNMDGDVMFFWDSDVIAPDHDALSRVIRLLDEDAVVVAGFPYYCEQLSFYERIMQAETQLNGLGFTAIEKAAFDKVGLFNEKLYWNEDTDFFSRVKQNGLKITFDGKTPCSHLKPPAPHSSRGKSVLNYMKYLKHCFSYYSFVYDEMVSRGHARRYLLRVLYYFGLPLVILAWLVNFVFVFLPVMPFTLFTAIYILFDLAYHVWKAKVKRWWGFASFVFYTSRGVVISYGYVAMRFSKLLKRKKQPPHVVEKNC